MTSSTDLDAQEVAEAGLLLDGPEELLDLLGVLVVGRDSGTQQAVGRRQPVEDVDAHLGVLEQLVRCVETGRPGADDRDPDRTRVG